MSFESLTATLVYPEHRLTPQDFLHFVETDEFAQDWENLGLNRENDLWVLQTAIMSKPDAGAVIKGTGGLRKLRFAPEEWNCGKSGAARVCYAYFPEHWTVLLVMAYDKTQKENLTANERKAIQQYLKSIEAFLQKHNY